MNSQTLAMLFGSTHGTLMMNIAGLNHEDSLRAPHPGGNCLNWVLGHIVATRNQVMALVGEPPVWSAEEAAPYIRGSAPLTAGSPARPFEEIIAALGRSQERILARLARMSEADLAAPAQKATVGSKLATLQFHEAYHAGQVGLLRRLVGKQGVIR